MCRPCVCMLVALGSLCSFIGCCLWGSWRLLFCRIWIKRKMYYLISLNFTHNVTVINYVMAKHLFGVSRMIYYQLLNGINSNAYDDSSTRCIVSQWFICVKFENRQTNISYAVVNCLHSFLSAYIIATKYNKNIMVKTTHICCTNIATQRKRWRKHFKFSIFKFFKLPDDMHRQSFREAYYNILRENVNEKYQNTFARKPIVQNNDASQEYSTLVDEVITYSLNQFWFRHPLVEKRCSEAFRIIFRKASYLSYKYKPLLKTGTRYLVSPDILLEKIFAAFLSQENMPLLKINA